MTKPIIDDKRKKKVEEATIILKNLGFPKEQLNERSALTLLALLNIKRNNVWSDCSNNLVRGTSEIIEFLNTHYEQDYKPNTRETFRKDTIDPFEIAGLIAKNFDEPERPVTSPKTSYRINDEALELLKNFNKKNWNELLIKYQKSSSSLKEKYAGGKSKNWIVLEIDEEILKISGGGQNDVLAKIVTHFRQIFTNTGIIIYLGDAKKKWLIPPSPFFKTLGIKIDTHGKMPDVIIYDSNRNWLFLIEAVTSHGPFTEKRKIELERIFENSSCSLIFVTAFPGKDYKNSSTDLRKIAWETEVWFADEPDHMIHFNGHKFLGPY
jgi:hypothetical protein